MINKNKKNLKTKLENLDSDWAYTELHDKINRTARAWQPDREPVWDYENHTLTVESWDNKNLR